MKTVNIVFLIFLCSVNDSSCANILVLNGIPSPSHHIWTSTILRALADRGHNVTSIGPDVDNKVTPNLHEIHLETVYPALYNTEIPFDILAMSKANLFNEVLINSEFCSITCNATMRSNGFNMLINYPKNFKFDLILYDCTCGPCLLSILSRFSHQPPLVIVTAYGHPSHLKLIIGEHPHYAYAPFNSLTYTRDMTFLQRLHNTILHTFDHFYRQKIFVPKIQKIVENKLNKRLSTGLEELEKTTNLALINSNPLFDFPEPLTPNTIEVAGLHIKEPKSLPKELEDFITTARKGFVLFSLGTNIRSDQLPPQTQQNIIKAFEQLPDYHFLWKFESDTLPKHPAKNVLIQKWMPQNDLLGHSKVKAFVTHGGLLSIQEASYHGVPIIGIPFIIDQRRNVHQCIVAGVGERVSNDQLATDELLKKLIKVLKNKSYSEKMKLRSQRFRDQMTKPLDRAVWWIEWAIRNPNAEHLRSPILKLGDFAGNSYDVLLVILITIGALVFCLFKMFTRLLVLVHNLRSNQVSKSKKEQ